jgi:hypothetical protein
LLDVIRSCSDFLPAIFRMTSAKGADHAEGE